MDFEERIAWIINYIKKEHSLNNVSLGKILGSNKNTIQAYSKGRGGFKGDVLAGIVKNYKINGEWLMAGKGEPFPGARDKYPEVCSGPPTPRAVYDRIDHVVKTAMAREAQAEYSLVEGQQVDIAIGKAYRVLAADNALSSSLFLIIHHFAAALDADSDLKHCKQQLADLREEFNVLKKRLDLVEAVPTEQKKVV